MAIRDWFKRKEKKQAPAPVYSGPVQPGTSEKEFRETGESTKVTAPSTTTPPRSSGGGRSFSGGGRSFSGPVPLGTSEKEFRETGVTQPLNQMQGEPSQYNITPSGSVTRKIDGRTQIQPADVQVAGSRTDLQREALLAGTLAPRFGTSGDIKTQYITKGEIQTSRELERFGVEGTYQSNIQKQFEGSGMTVENFMASPEYKSTTAAAQTKFESIKDVPRLYSDPARFSDDGFFKPIGDFISSERGWIAAPKTYAKDKSLRTKEESVNLYERIYEGRDTRARVAERGLFKIGEIGLIAAPIGEVGVTFGEFAVEKALSRGVSKGVANLGESQLITGEIVDIGSGKFAQGFTQESLGFGRAGKIFGSKIDLGKGLGIIPKATGESVYGGTFKLTGLPKVGAKIIGADTSRTIIGAETFDIGGVGLATEGGKVAGFQTARITGIGTFTPTESTFTIIKPGRIANREMFGTLGKPGQFQTNLAGEGRTITSQFKSPTFSVDFGTGKLSFSTTPEVKGFSYATDIKALSKPNVQVESFVSDATKVKAGRKTFLDTIKVETPKVPEIKFPTSKNGLVMETPTTNIQTKQISETGQILQKGFSETKILTSKPFSITKPSFGVSSLSATSIGLTSMALPSFKLGTSQLTKTSQLQQFKPKQITSQLTGTDTVQAGTFATPTIKPTITSSFGGITPTTPTPRTPFIPILPLFKPKFGTAGGVGNVGGSQLFKYTPSFTALKFGITATKQSKGIKIGGKEVYSGFETRAIVKKRKAKKKSKKK